MERRECWVIGDPAGLEYLSDGAEWSQLRSVVKVFSHRKTAQGTMVQPRYYISSRAAQASAPVAAVRTHWSIGNPRHWNLDVAFSPNPPKG